MWQSRHDCACMQRIKKVYKKKSLKSFRKYKVKKIKKVESTDEGVKQLFNTVLCNIISFFFLFALHFVAVVVKISPTWD